MTSSEWIQLLNKSQGPLMTIQYIQNLLSSPDEFFFTDLLSLSNVQLVNCLLQCKNIY